MALTGANCARGVIVPSMSSRMAGLALAGVCAGALACGGSPQTADGGPRTPIAGCPNLSGYAACTAREVTEPFVPRPASVLLVVERSGRLRRVPAGATDDTWTAMTTGLAAALDRPWANVEFALLGYPSGMSGGCGEACCYVLPAASAVRGPFGPESAARIVEVLLSDQPEGEAPMAAALATARQYLTEVDVPDRGDAFVVLVAGGGPDCGAASACAAARCVPDIEARCPIAGSCCASAPAGCLDDQAVGEQIAALATAGIATVVVALPDGASFASVFDGYARAGGRPDPTTRGAYRAGVTAAEIEATMTAIFTGLGARCEAALPSSPPAPELAHVAAGCEIVAGAQLRPDPNGDATRVVLEGDVCGALASAVPPRVNVLAGCPSAP
jgi:hypothetical protein